MMGGVSCWKTSIDADLKTRFIGYQSIVESFGSGEYGTEFEPIKYKT
jgi:hypothetical protein